MDGPQKSRWRVLGTATAGLALAFVVATIVPVRADSGGLFCAYGDCHLYYDGDCGSVGYEDLGGGNCRITFTDPVSCNWDYGCTGEQFGWKGIQNFTWETEVLIQR